MTPSRLQSAIIMEILDELSKQGIVDLNPTLSRLLNELMKIEREQVLGASLYERTEERQGYANGYKDKKLQTRFGQLDLQVPLTRGVAFYPKCLEKGERSERALKLAIAEAYVLGVSTRCMHKLTQELCGMDISSTQVSRLNAALDEELEGFRNRPIGRLRYLYLDARYEKVRHQGHVSSLAVLIAVGVNEQGHREVVGISVSLSEAEVHWRTLLGSLQQRGLHGLELIVSDDHAGLRSALRAVFPSVPWQRCIFHLAQNAQAYAPNVGLRLEIARAVRDIYSAPSAPEAEERLKRTVDLFKSRAQKFCEWLEENFREGLTFYRFPREHWSKLRTVNVMERVNQEVKRRTRAVRVFPSETACLRLVSAVLSEIHEEWVSGKKYVTFE